MRIRTGFEGATPVPQNRVEACVHARCLATKRHKKHKLLGNRLRLLCFFAAEGFEAKPNAMLRFVLGSRRTPGFDFRQTTKTIVLRRMGEHSDPRCNNRTEGDLPPHLVVSSDAPAGYCEPVTAIPVLDLKTR